MSLLQEALDDAIAGIGIMGIAPSDDTGQPVSAAARELRARNVSDLWLRRYLSPNQLDAIAGLSLFAATFDAAGAAAVLHGADPGPSQRRNTELLLRCLRGLSILQEVPRAAAGEQQPRYGMHLLVRGLAVPMCCDRQPEDSQDVSSNWVRGLLAHSRRQTRIPGSAVGPRSGGGRPPAGSGSAQYASDAAADGWA